MEAHVWAVWDFQSLLKAMQRHLTCVSLPWLPTADAEARRLANEIVLDEETDILPDGSYASHFELYLQSMRAAGADTTTITRALERLAAGDSLQTALDIATPPAAARRFVERSFLIIESNAAHRVVAAAKMSSPICFDS